MVSNSKHSIGKTLFMAIMITMSFLIPLLYLSNSWIKIATLGLILASSTGWLASRGLLRRVFKYIVVCVLIFAISFSAFEGYMFRNAGYPPTFGDSQQGVTLSYPNILDVSLIELVRDIKDTSAYKLLMIEHPGDVSIGTITLDTRWQSGQIEVVFYHETSNLGFRFSASGGPYHVSHTSTVGTPTRFNFYQQTPDRVLQQVDNLGLQWYYERAIEEYQNKTGTTPEINELTITFMWGEHGNYQGMVLEMIGSYVDNGRGSGVFFANFQPDGTLNYLNTTI